MESKDQIIATLTKLHDKKTILLLAKSISADEKLIKLFIDLTHYQKQEIGFRAAWALEQTLLFSDAGFLSNLKHFLESYLKQTNLSCQRHYTKILMYFTATKPMLRKLEAYDLEPVVEKTFEWLIDPHTPVAVKVNCLDALFNLRHVTDWIDMELEAQVEFLMKDGSAAMMSRGRKILQKMRKDKR